jgi:predicted ATPase
MNNRNAARRFILLVPFFQSIQIDEIYNHHVKLYVTAQTDLMSLFVVKTGNESYDEEFALERCRSRLYEMQTKEYINKPSYYEQKFHKVI